MPLATYPSLVDDKGPFAEVTLAVWMKLELGEQLSKGVDGFFCPLVLGHQGYEGVLRHGDLAKAKVDVRDDIFRGFDGGDGLQRHKVIDPREAESIIVLRGLELCCIRAALRCEVPEFNVFEIFEAA